MKTNQAQPDLLTTAEAADILRYSPATLHNLRHTKGIKLRFYKIGRAVRYSRSDIEDYLESCACDPEKQEPCN